ncbi:MAG: hypothetical protein ACE5MG_06170 [Candidatus Methylomirabilales bacterium]
MTNASDLRTCFQTLTLSRRDALKLLLGVGFGRLPGATARQRMAE